MIEYISLAVAFGGSSLAAAWDLKTTEIPDEIPHAMMFIGIILALIASYAAWSYWPLANSLIFGLGFLGIGFLMYYFGQWGGGDAKILSAVGFLLPTMSSFFAPNFLFPTPISYFFNVFVIGAVYMLLYAFVLALLNKKILIEFVKNFKGSRKILFLGSSGLFILFLAANWLLFSFFQISFNLVSLITNSVLPLIATIILFIIFKFAKTVEDVGFKKRIPISKLRIGDVLEKSKLWEGITEKELKKIKKSGKKFITIKSGVRFAPAFPLALLFTLYFGDTLLFLVKLI